MPVPNSTPCAVATRRISSGSPNSMQVAIPRSAQIAAALTVRGSSPSGKTIRFFALRANSVN